MRNGDVQQAQGRGNGAPTGYARGLGALVRTLGVGIGRRERPGLFGLARIDDVLMPVDEALARLAANGKIVGDVDFRGCPSLTSLPGGLQVGGWLFLAGCASLAGLPDGLVVGGNLYLSDVQSLASLPVGLKIGGDIYLRRCTSLASLPEGLEVGRGLYLNGCTSLTSLPEGLEVGGRIIGADLLPRKPSRTRSPDTGMTR